MYCIPLVSPVRPTTAWLSIRAASGQVAIHKPGLNQRGESINHNLHEEAGKGFAGIDKGKEGSRTDKENPNQPSVERTFGDWDTSLECRCHLPFLVPEPVDPEDAREGGGSDTP